MNIEPRHLDALQALGYTESEARGNFSLSRVHIGVSAQRSFGASSNGRDTPASSDIRRPERSTTSSRVACIARSKRKTSETVGRTLEGGRDSR
jgi:hypothetical protein